MFMPATIKNRKPSKMSPCCFRTDFVRNLCAARRRENACAARVFRLLFNWFCANCVRKSPVNELGKEPVKRKKIVSCGCCTKKPHDTWRYRADWGGASGRTRTYNPSVNSSFKLIFWYFIYYNIQWVSVIGMWYICDSEFNLKFIVYNWLSIDDPCIICDFDL